MCGMGDNMSESVLVNSIMDRNDLEGSLGVTGNC